MRNNIGADAPVGLYWTRKLTVIFKSVFVGFARATAACALRAPLVVETRWCRRSSSSAAVDLWRRLRCDAWRHSSRRALIAWRRAGASLLIGVRVSLTARVGGWRLLTPPRRAVLAAMYTVARRLALSASGSCFVRRTRSLQSLAPSCCCWRWRGGDSLRRLWRRPASAFCWGPSLGVRARAGRLLFGEWATLAACFDDGRLPALGRRLR